MPRRRPAASAAGCAEGGRLARHLPSWQVIAWAVLAALPVTALTCALALPAEIAVTQRKSPH
jgi:hypothetical protein